MVPRGRRARADRPRASTCRDASAIPPSPRPRRARDPTPRGKCLEAKHRKRLGTSARHRARDGRRRQRVYEGIARKVTLNPHLLTYVFTVWSRTLSILTGLRDGRRGVIHDGAVVGARPCGPSKPSAVSSASAAARSEPARRLAAERSAAPMALWIESAAREASVSPGTCGEKRRRRDEHLHARAHRVSRGTERVPTPAQRASKAVVWAPQRRASRARLHLPILAACAAARGRGQRGGAPW